jgi:hypothetical protein
LGFKITYMAADIDSLIDDRCICTWVFCGGTREELNQSSSWYRISTICDDFISILGWLVCTFEIEGDDTT